MQDVREEVEELNLVDHYLNPPSKQPSQSQGFVVRDAPWAKSQNQKDPRKVPAAAPPPDTSNVADFPAIGSSGSAPKAMVWGPSRH